MANMGQALLSGLVQGFDKYAGMKVDEKQKAEKAQRDQELAKLQQQLWEAAARFEQGLKPAQYQTIKDTGPDGQLRERTIRSSYDPESQGFTETEVGNAPIEATQKRAESDAEFFARDPEGFKVYKASGRAPIRTGAGGEKPEKSTEASTLTAAEMDGMFGQTAKDGTTTVDPKAYKQFLAYQARNAARDPKFRDAKYAAQQWANQVGVDPDEDVPGADRIEKPLMESARGSEQAPSGSGGNARSPSVPLQSKSQSTPGATRDNPVPAQSFKSKPPSGTWVKLPNGQVIQVP